MKSPNRLSEVIPCLVGVLLLVAGFPFLRASNATVTTAVKSSGEISPELKQDLQGILRQSELQQKNRIMLHLRFDYLEEYWVPSEGKFLPPPQDTVGEATVDIANGKVRYRTEYKPEVSRWTDGAQPFLIKNRTEITDGTLTWFDRGETPRKGAGDLGYLLGYRYRADSQLQFAMQLFLSSNKPVNAPLYDVQRSTLKGRTVVRVQDIIKTGYGTQRRTWWLDPRHNYALVQYEWASFHGSSSQPSSDNLTSADDLQEIAPEIWYPTQYTTVNSTYKDGKLADLSFHATAKLTNLTILPKVDDRLFQP